MPCSAGCFGGAPIKHSPFARPADNWAFLYAQRLALKQELPLRVCFCLVPAFLDATIRHYGFMLRGLREVAKVRPPQRAGGGWSRLGAALKPRPLIAGVCGAGHPLPRAAGLPQGCSAQLRGGARRGRAGDRLLSPPCPPAVGGGGQGAIA